MRSSSAVPAERFLVPGLLLGFGLGGFVDGILLHQVFQWHHMLTDYDSDERFPATTVAALEENTLADGLFHLSTWILLVVGLILLWRAMSTDLGGSRPSISGRAFVGLLLAGWGLFNLLEGVVDHHILTLHHVRDDVAEPLPWDLGFLAFGASLVAVGVSLYRRGDHSRTRARGGDRAAEQL
jgi:uncharacterized membrane protein